MSVKGGQRFCIGLGAAVLSSIALNAVCIAQDETGAPQQELLPIERYFPMDHGVFYAYRVKELEKQVTVRLGRGTASEREYRNSFYAYYTRPNPRGEGTYFELLAAADSETGPVFREGLYLGTLGPDWAEDRDYGAQHLPLVGRVLPEELTAIGQEWEISLDAEVLEAECQAVGRVAGIETAEVTGIGEDAEGSEMYFDCLRLEYSLSIDEEYEESWFTPAGHLAAGATVIVWLAPDIGLVKGIVRIDEVDTDISLIEFYELLADEEILVVELLARRAGLS